jgi:hypothetical protein
MAASAPPAVAAAAAAAEDATTTADAPPPPPTQPSRTTYRTTLPYASCYCEENAYLLIKRLLLEQQQQHSESLFAVFISNPSRRTPIWRQRAAGQHKGGVCLWDYHVFVVSRRGQGTDVLWVYDHDTTIEPFPAPFELYCAEALRPYPPSDAVPPRCYRVVGARELLATFASDRSHMRTEDGGWSAPPPPWPLIAPENGGESNTNMLPAFLDMRRQDAAPGHLLLSDQAFFDFFAGGEGVG